MILLPGPGALLDRARFAEGPLAALAGSLTADLDRLLPDEDVFIPREKAKLTRHGGRCARDGVLLEFDPRQPRRHRCPSCGAVYDDEAHYLWWVMGYQLWLAERAVHAAVLWRLRGDARHERLSWAILQGLAERYPAYPNQDNVLGPTRVFFSTYLESIWLLQLSIALSALEEGRPTAGGDRIRDIIIEPSSRIIAAFNEGGSNRQVWNSAAVLAASILLKDPGRADRALHGPGGLTQHLREGLLEDGTWFEGENYHLFAHRGLWYLVSLAEWAGFPVAGEDAARFERGFVAPLRSALPDFTFPSRRDSQYRASLRQWRVAESLELGLARSPGSADLARGLAAVYGDAPVGDAARWRSTAEAERNVPGVRLTRADLGWKSLLFAVPRLPDAEVPPPASVLLERQGFGILRRNSGRTYVALDYGESGGSHGHPDRLNLWLVHGEQRVFEDVGTGSYVERSLHWYRSTLAHNAPLVDGRSQGPVPGRLRAWDERVDCGWIDADVHLARGVLVRRSVVACRDHLVDRVEWSAPGDVTLDLPMHVDGDLAEAAWTEAGLAGGDGLEDGFPFVVRAETAGPRATASIVAEGVHGVTHVTGPHGWWRAVAPGPPGAGPRRFLLLRSRGASGRITSVWSWQGPVAVTFRDEGTLTVTSERTWTHVPRDRGWVVEGAGTSIALSGARALTADAAPARPAPTEGAEPLTIPAVTASSEVGHLIAHSSGALRFRLDERHYRRTEAPWSGAGSPTAVVALAADAAALYLEVAVTKKEVFFAPPGDDNPLDNEHPDTNSDGVQVHLAWGEDPGRTATWLMVPDPGSSGVRVSSREAPGAVSATWRRRDDGWQLLARMDRAVLGLGTRFRLGVIVNEMPPWRERRRGQLVLGGARDEWAYLRGDRHDAQLIPMIFTPETADRPRTAGPQ